MPFQAIALSYMLKANQKVTGGLNGAVYTWNKTRSIAHHICLGLLSKPRSRYLSKSTLRGLGDLGAYCLLHPICFVEFAIYDPVDNKDNRALQVRGSNPD